VRKLLYKIIGKLKGGKIKGQIVTFNLGWYTEKVDSKKPKVRWKKRLCAGQCKKNDLLYTITAYPQFGVDFLHNLPIGQSALSQKLFYTILTKLQLETITAQSKSGLSMVFLFSWGTTIPSIAWNNLFPISCLTLFPSFHSCSPYPYHSSLLTLTVYFSGPFQPSWVLGVGEHYRLPTAAPHVKQPPPALWYLKWQTRQR